MSVRKGYPLLKNGLGIGVVFGVVLAAYTVSAQDQSMIQAGADVYQTNCAVCHGERLVNPGSSFDLRQLRPEERARFNESVTEGKGQMPAWGGVLSDEEFDQLWAYIRSRADR